MKYDFTSVIDRRGKDALAVDGIGIRSNAPIKPKQGFDFIPMWVADMNFATAPAITQALQDRIAHPLYGYYIPSERYYEAIIDWQREQNNVKKIKTENIGYQNGVLGGMVSALEVLSTVGDAVLINSPTYIGFIHTIKKSGREIVYSPLKQDASGIWKIDYEDMENKIKKHHIHTVIFCSPHNPCGRVWEKEELEKVAEILEKNECYVIADEIWSDILLRGHRHIPFQSINLYTKNHTIALYSPSKTFNLAGMTGGYHIIYNSYLNHQMKAQSDMSHYNSMNVLSMHALIGAYSEGGREWLKELNMVLTENIEYACRYICDNLIGVSCAKPEATYMLFLDCTQYCQRSQRSLDDVLSAGWNAGIGWQDGRPFQGMTHIRINLALPFVIVKEALRRMHEYVFVL